MTLSIVLADKVPVAITWVVVPEAVLVDCDAIIACVVNGITTIILAPFEVVNWCSIEPLPALVSNLMQSDPEAICVWLNCLNQFLVSLVVDRGKMTTLFSASEHRLCKAAYLILSLTCHFKV